MDPKATAKSKRSHSLHGRRAHRHHNHQQPPPTPSTSSDKGKTEDTLLQQQQLQQPPRPQKPSLPSNWDRYQEDDDEDQHPSNAPATSFATPKPKSKGADFSFLLQQARDTPRPPPSLDDALPDYLRGLSPCVTQRGKRLLLSCATDDFIVDDEATSNFEVPFLSLDLHALAVRLEDLKLSRRLFIHADYLEETSDNEELSKSGASYASHEEPAEHLKNKIHSTSDVVEEPKVSRIGRSIAQPLGEFFMAPDVLGAGVFRASSSRMEECFSAATSMKDHNKVQERHGSMFPEDALNVVQTDLDRSSRCDTSTSETELDMLLDSLGQIKLPVFSSQKSSNNASIAGQFGGYGSLAHVGISSVRHDSGSSKYNLIPEDNHTSNASNSFLDGTIDDLLRQTSLTASNQKSLTSHEVGKPAANISQALDDLDSLLDGF